MGLYLCLFDEIGDEIDGVEVGSYSDFNFLRDAVTAVIERGQSGSVCPTLQHHSDSDGSWSPEDAKALLKELELIEQAFSNNPPAEFNSAWKTEVARMNGIIPSNLLECFFDVDGEPLINRIRKLALSCIENNSPILFQ